jgi:putative DNA primase/helicase
VLAPGPGHSRRDRSLSIRLDARAPGGLLVHSFAGDNPLAAKDYVRERLGIRRQSGATLVSMSQPPSERDSGTERSEAERTASALSIWAEAQHPRGTPVESYFRRRGIVLPDDAAGEAIRFHPCCPFTGERTPAMVCLVRDVITNEPKAIHRSALSRDGRKVQVRGAPRRSLGPIGGGVIKLTPDEEVTTCLGLGEGIETTLSMRLVPEYGTSAQRELLSGDELLGDIETFTDEQRKARETFMEQQLHLPREWLCEDGCSGLDAPGRGGVTG